MISICIWVVLLTWVITSCEGYVFNRIRVLNAQSRLSAARNNRNFHTKRKPQFTKRKFDSPRHEITKGKVMRLLTDELYDIICGGEVKAAVMPDSFLLSSVSIDEIELNNDFSIADVFVSCYGNAVERREVFVWLCHNERQIQHLLTQRLRFLRKVPEIVFQLVDHQEETFFQQAMEEIAEESRKQSEEGEGEEGDWEVIDYEEKDRD